MLEMLLAKHEGLEFKIYENSFKIIDGRLNIYYELTNQFMPIYFKHLGQDVQDKIEEVLSGE
jgi:hypothetical protein